MDDKPYCCEVYGDGCLCGCHEVEGDKPYCCEVYGDGCLCGCHEVEGDK